MSKEINYDDMSYDEVEAILQQIDSGTFEQGESTARADDDTSTSETNDLGSDENNNAEDTDDSDDSQDDTDTEDQDDDSDTATGSEGDDEDSANTQETNQDDNGQNADTSANEDASGTETGKIDPNEYARLKQFYDAIANAEFVANGKKVKGFTDPEKIIRSQQMLHGYSDRMKGFNEYRPFMKALKENGLLEDESKFNFALSLLKGDKAAIKQHMKTLSIDPVDLELDETVYKPTNYVASKESLILEDTLQVARESGIEDKLRKTIGEQWDNESFQEFVSNAEVRQDLLEHMQTGAFDLVQDKIAEMELLDTYGTFRNMKSTDKYREAVQVVNRELAAKRSAEPQRLAPQESPQYVAQQQNNRIDTALLAKKEAEYKAQVEQKNREADEARKKAAAISKKKATTTQTKKFDPLTLEGDDLNSFVDGLISGNIK